MLCGAGIRLHCGDEGGVLYFAQLVNGSNAVDIVTTLCMLTGLWQVLLAGCRFANLSWLMSDIFMSAYISGAAIHIAVSQIKHLLGLSLTFQTSKLCGLLIVSNLLIHQRITSDSGEQ